MMTKDGDAANSAAGLVSVSSQAAVLVTLPTLPTTMATADIGTHILQGTTIKEEADDHDEFSAPLAVGVHPSSSISNVRATHATLQSLLAAPISAARMLPQQEQTIQVITLPSSSNLITTHQPDGAGRIWQVVPSISSPDIATIIAVADTSELIHTTKTDLGEGIDLDIHEASGELSVTNTDSMSAILMPPPPPADCPTWAARLHNCEKIGESYRGYVESEVELDLLLTYHKQQTSSFWGTRQSPSPAKPSTRLMWKSQYVPFDGIPFVNIGSRAVVMECQYGPRRKGNASKRYNEGSQVNQYRQTCPARIYIKRVRKFPEYAVDLRQDKKALRIAMDKAFHELREHRLEGCGTERFYVQLPTEKAHEFHDDMGIAVSEKKEVMSSYDAENSCAGVGAGINENEPEGVRLHPKVVQKIRSIVASGETRIYAIRKQLRAYVLREMFVGSDKVPERHDLTLFPTVNDLKNHLHQAIKDIENGSLGVTASTVNVEILQGDGTDNSEELGEGEDRLSALLDSGMTTSLAMPETVTVTLTQNPDADGHHIISRIETHLSDGTTQVSTTLTPETAQLLSRLHPAIFPADSLMQLGASNTSEDLATPVAELDVVPPGASEESPAAMVVMTTDEGGGQVMEESAASEGLPVVSPDEGCSQLLQSSGEQEPAVVPVGLPVAVSGEDSVMVAGPMDEEVEKAGEGLLVSDTDMITISMTDDNQLVLTTPVPETFEPQ